MNKTSSNKVTPYPEINEILLDISDDIKNILGQNLIGLYLFGSLSYGDFNPDTSDIDIVAILNNPLDQQALQLIKGLHEAIKKKYPKWSDRLECSYTSIDMLKNIWLYMCFREVIGGIGFPRKNNSKSDTISAPSFTHIMCKFKKSQNMLGVFPRNSTMRRSGTPV